MQVTKVKSSGDAPTVRGYHSFHIMGKRCYVIGGRTASETLLTDDDFLCIYDAVANAWVKQAALPNTPAPRSSHRGVALGSNQLVICGGAGKTKKRLEGTHVLRLSSKGTLAWSCLNIPPLPIGMQARACMIVSLLLQSVTNSSLPTFCSS